MIRLKTLEFDNIFSYGPDNIIDLSAAPMTQLTASNGSGKTSIALIIQELLYSKNIKSIKKGDLKNRYVKGNEWAGSLIFEVDGREYEIQVTRKGATSKVSLYEDGLDISEHKVLDTYKKVREILGMDFEIFSQLTYQSSTDLLQFIKATDTNRKKFLINLFNLERYVEIGEVIKIKLNEVEKESIHMDGELQGIERFLASTTIPDKIEEVDVPEVDPKLSEDKGRLEVEVENHNTLCKRIDKNNLHIQERDVLTFDIGMAEPMETVGQHELTDILTQIRTIKAENTQLESQKGKLDIADTCYACHQPLDNTQAVKMKEDIEKQQLNLMKQEKELADRHKTLHTEWTKHQEKLKEYQENRKKIERFEQLAQLIDTSLPTTYPDIVQIRSNISNINSTLSTQTAARNEALAHNREVNTHNTKVDALIQQKREFLARKEIISGEIDEVKTRVKNLNILRKAFSTSGIVAFKLENLTKELEDSINLYLAELSDGQFQVIFRLTGDKLNVIIRNHGIETPVESLSSGEFSRVQTAILLAIRTVLTKIGGNTVNTLFLDEIDGVLDDAGKERLIEVLQEEKGLNVFLISHGFTHPLIDKISIVKEDNISRIE